MAQVTCNNCGLELPESEASPSMVGWLCAECAEARPESADIQQTYRNNALYSCVCAVVSYYFKPLRRADHRGGHPRCAGAQLSEQARRSAARIPGRVSLGEMGRWPPASSRRWHRC